MAFESLFCVFWIKNTIRNVMIVVPVLITNCQVSEKSNIGPVIAQTTTVPAANKKATELPVAFVAHSANRSKKPFFFLPSAFLLFFRFAMALNYKPIYAKLIP